MSARSAQGGLAAGVIRRCICSKMAGYAALIRLRLLLRVNQESGRPTRRSCSRFLRVTQSTLLVRIAGMPVSHEPVGKDSLRGLVVDGRVVEEAERFACDCQSTNEGVCSSRWATKGAR